MPAAPIREVYLQPAVAMLPYWYLEMGKFMRRKNKRQKAKQRSTCGLSIKWITKTGIQTKENIREEELLELDSP